MKLGIIFGDGNRILEPGNEQRMGYNQHPNTFTTFPKLYPDDIFAYLSPYAIDLDICRQLDAAVYYSGLPDRKFVNVIEKIPCKVIMMLTRGYATLIHTSMEDIRLTKELMDRADFVLGYDEYFRSLVSLFTDTPIIIINLPMPLEYTAEYAGTSDNCYDIIVPYGPYECGSTSRNGYVTALIAQKLIDTVPGFNSMAIFNMISDAAIMQESIETLDALGCRNYKLFPLIPYRQFVGIMSNAKLGLNLDINTGAGKFAIDCAMLRKHGIFSNTQPYARNIYQDVPGALVDPLDVDTIISLAGTVWTENDYDSAYLRALRYNIADAALKLEQEVLGE